MMGTTKESELHILGKSVFEDAEGKDIQLPAAEFNQQPKFAETMFYKVDPIIKTARGLN